ncbi:hypothetical protein [Acidiphilium angustum]|uniref:hypothetical protein n=1 Tax=Acidiphilium angustum TaxID=523 RepID=UPI0004949EBD|nr:hypothetical protein [Acidiphilium angustum]
MSESAGASTFSQPSSPTSGLAGYDLGRRAKSLYPASAQERPVKSSSAHRAKLRLAFRRKHLSKKDAPDMSYIAAMVGTLQKSVDQIVSSSSPNRDDLLKQTFAEFQAEMVKGVPDAEAIETGVLNKLEAEGALDIPLFKGMGAVGAIANMVSSLTDKIRCIQDGLDYPGQETPGKNSDPASPAVAEMLEHLLVMAELVLRAAVNEHVSPLGDDEDADHIGDGMHLVLIPSADHPDSAEHAIVGKSVLVDDLRKFATDPAALANSALETGMALFDLAGIDTDTLGKALEGGDLSKAFPPGAAAAGGAPDTGSGADGGAGDATADAGGALPDQSNENPLEVLGRILALAMVQLDHIQQMVDGTDEPIDDTADGNEGNDGADPSAASAGGAAPPVNKAAPTGDLAKLDNASTITEALAKLDPAVGGVLRDALEKAVSSGEELVKLRTQATETDKLVKELLARPTTPKAHVAEVPVALSKAEDGGVHGSLAANRDEALAKMSKDDAVVDMIKQAQRRPMPG